MSYRAPGICVRDRRVACAGGTAAWLLCGKHEDWLVNPLTAAHLPRYLGDSRGTYGWMDHSHGVVSGDGTILVFGFDLLETDRPDPYYRFKGFILKCGYGEWVHLVGMFVSRLPTDRCCRVREFGSLLRPPAVRRLQDTSNEGTTAGRAGRQDSSSMQLPRGVSRRAAACKCASTGELQHVSSSGPEKTDINTPRRSQRPSRPSTRVAGPEWTK